MAINLQFKRSHKGLCNLLIRYNEILKSSFKSLSPLLGGRTHRFLGYMAEVAREKQAVFRQPAGRNNPRQSVYTLQTRRQANFVYSLSILAGEYRLTNESGDDSQKIDRYRGRGGWPDDQFAAMDHNPSGNQAE